MNQWASNICQLISFHSRDTEFGEAYFCDEITGTYAPKFKGYQAYFNIPYILDIT